MLHTQVQVHPLRILCASAVIVAITASFLFLSTSLPATPVNTALTVLMGIVLMPIMASPVEWLVHRYIYHRRFTRLLHPLYNIHHRVHHYVYFPTWRYVTGGEPRRIPVFSHDHDHMHTSPIRNALVHLSHFAFYMLLAIGTIWLPVWFLTKSLPLLIGIAMSSVLVCDLMVTVHDTIHRPGAHPFIERQAWFRFLDRHHYIHHVDTEANVNFLLPLADWAYGTLRRGMTAEELAKHGTWEEAKAVPLGEGEPAYEALEAAGLVRGKGQPTASSALAEANHG